MSGEVDPELLSALDLMPRLELSVEALPTLRQGLAAMIAPTPVADFPVSVRERLIPGPPDAPPVRVLEYLPIATKGSIPAILHIHAGGFVIGAPDMMDTAHRALAVDLGCAILSVDYRLAPETRYPGAIEDCYAALAWLHREASALRIDPARIGVNGESAGGGLAAALALLARDRGDLAIAFQHLHYPMLDDRTTAASANPHASDLVWSPDQNAFGWSALLGDEAGSPGVPAYAAPARATDLSGLPPAFMALGALDVLADEGLDYARRLMGAGVAVELHVTPGAFHAFDIAPEARSAIAARLASREALRRALHG